VWQMCPYRLKLFFIMTYTVHFKTRNYSLTFFPWRSANIHYRFYKFPVKILKKNTLESIYFSISFILIY